MEGWKRIGSNQKSIEDAVRDCPSGQKCKIITIPAIGKRTFPLFYAAGAARRRQRVPIPGTGDREKGIPCDSVAGAKRFVFSPPDYQYIILPDGSRIPNKGVRKGEKEMGTKEARECLEWTQTRLATEAGVSVSTVRRMEYEERHGGACIAPGTAYDRICLRLSNALHLNDLKKRPFWHSLFTV